MGCHTWFYKRVEVDFDTMRNMVLNNYKKSMDRYDRWILNPTDPEYLDMLSAYPEWTLDLVEQWRDVNRKQISMIEKVLCKEAIISKYCSFSSGVNRYIKGKGIFMECGYHDIFRKYGYPEDMLFSYEDTLDYIDYPGNNCQLYDHSLEKLKEFWEKYPDGMIDFG